MIELQEESNIVERTVHNILKGHEEEQLLKESLDLSLKEKDMLKLNTRAVGRLIDKEAKIQYEELLHDRKMASTFKGT